jgi:hypothetical protein
MDQQTIRYTLNQTQSFDTAQIDGLPSPHPLGRGLGAAGGGMAGAAIGSVIGGPVGAAVGAMFGGLLGACGGQGIARALNANERLEAAGGRGFQPGDDDAPHVYNYADKEYERIRDECERAHEGCATLAIPWEQARPFAARGWSRLSGVIGPRDTDRGLRGGI